MTINSDETLNSFGVIPVIAVSACLMGAFYGLVTYVTYDLTVYASLNIFSLKIVITDILWGMVLSGLVASLTVFTSAKLN